MLGESLDGASGPIRRLSSPSDRRDSISSAENRVAFQSCGGQGLSLRGFKDLSVSKGGIASGVSDLASLQNFRERRDDELTEKRCEI